MSWTICLILSVAALVLALLFACKRIKYKRGRIMDPLRIMFVGVVLSTLFLFAPILMKTCENSGYVGWEFIPLALHNVIKLFVVDADLKDVFDMVGGGVIGCLYRIVFSVRLRVRTTVLCSEMPSRASMASAVHRRRCF